MFPLANRLFGANFPTPSSAERGPFPVMGGDWQRNSSQVFSGGSKKGVLGLKLVLVRPATNPGMKNVYPPPDHVE